MSARVGKAPQVVDRAGNGKGGVGWPSRVTTLWCGTSRGLKILTLYLCLQVVEGIFVKIGGRDRI